jgi:hypothetical protein
MKNSKSRNEVNRQRYDDYEEFNKTKKKPQPKRRPVKNWKHVWEENQDVYDDVDDIFKY